MSNIKKYATIGAIGLGAILAARYVLGETGMVLPGNDDDTGNDDDNGGTLPPPPPPPPERPYKLKQTGNTTYTAAGIISRIMNYEKICPSDITNLFGQVINEESNEYKTLQNWFLNNPQPIPNPDLINLGLENFPNELWSLNYMVHSVMFKNVSVLRIVDINGNRIARLIPSIGRNRIDATTSSAGQIFTDYFSHINYSLIYDHVCC